jgi:hypothetical protein
VGREASIVAFTGWTHEKTRDQAKANGFDFFLMKPLDPEILIDWLVRVEQQRAPAERSTARDR